ncbi:MAG TPA: DNA polymerase II large subunit, partial [Candidatus Thermoplasmatota archaeon]|nr:DNA polymerase II large subunit [Candidatus Thermoplasmatota archaeon]
GRLEGDRLVLANDPLTKETLIVLGALHELRPRAGEGGDATGILGPEVLVGRHSYALVRALGLDGAPDGKLVRIQPLDAVPGEDTCAYVSRLAGVRVRERAPARIGARMGRPEKAAERKMSPPVHVLFPLGNQGGPQRLVSEAAKAGPVDVEVGTRQCPQCRDKTILNVCPRCRQPDGRGVHTEPVVPRGEGPRPRIEPQRVDLPALTERARQGLGLDRLPESVKGVQGLISARKTPEPLEKGYLRAIHGVFMFKDGTARFDMTDVTLTHFRPAEIHTPVARLREFGYTHDAHGAPLERDDQVLELFPQDIVVSTTCLEYMLKASRYVDDLLVRFYAFKPYYNCERKEDLVGQLFVGLAPHTSGGVLCRVIGHTTAQAGFGHPFFHAAKRRNCDGDEDCVMLLLDGLLNFSRSYLPSSRGGLMDAPLTLTLRLDPSEVDKEAHNVDVMWRYPLEFFEATCRHPEPGEVTDLIDSVSKRLGRQGQYEGFGFTHDTRDIAAGPSASAYKTIGDMLTKMTAQLDLGAKIRAVDAPDVAARVIGSHFLPDLMGNLKAFSKQKVRCTKCGAKFRRIPLSGKCHKCGQANLTMTVYEASVRKYLEVSKEICERYGVNPYVRQRIEHIEDSIESLFQNDRVKKARLTDFL